MKSLRERLGLSKSSKKQQLSDLKTSLAKEIATSHPDLSVDRLRFLAAFGGLLGRVAAADGVIDPEEIQRIEAILSVFTKIPESESTLITRLIMDQTLDLVGLENHLYTREINELADKSKKLEILSCLFAVAAADDTISPEENQTLRLISDSLKLTPDDFLAVRSLYRDKLSVLKNLPK